MSGKLRVSASVSFMRAMALCGLLFSIGCATDKQVLVNPHDERLTYMGRVGKPSPEAAELYWSGTSVKLNFDGKSVQARLKDNTGNSYYNVILDQDSSFILKPDTVLQLFTLAQNLKPGKHTVELFKRTEWDKGKTTFQGFVLDKTAKILPPDAPKTRRIEFYGNSISAGYAVEDTTGKDNPAGTNTNNYVSYAALAARHFSADYSCVCKSGIGIMISWFPFTMPEIYDRLNPDDPASRWNFSKGQPDVVVINLFQNDSWLVKSKSHPEFMRVFGTEPPSEEFIITAYQNFVKAIRQHYPQAHIICALGNMDITREGSAWPGYVQKAVNGLQDDKIYTHFMPYKNSPGHPTVPEQQAMAQSLIQFIESKLGW